MNKAQFEEAIAGLPLEKAEFFPTVGSTNDVVVDWAREGAKGLYVAVADEQTRGRGRAGRRWFTPRGSALAISFLVDLAPSFDQAMLGRVSGLGALAVCEALESSFQLRPKIKWPNDVLLNGKKMCGVLPEAHWSGEHLQALVLGIGINIAVKSVPSAEVLDFPATSLERELGWKTEAGGVLRAVLAAVVKWKEKLGDPDFIQEWDKRLAYKGEAVRLESIEQPSTEAVLVGLATDGAILMRLPKGELRAFQAGEVRLRSIVGSREMR